MKARDRLAQAAAPRPDYALIARMEMEIYGEVFRHEGAPDHIGEHGPFCFYCARFLARG